MPRLNGARGAVVLLCALLASAPGPIGPSAMAQVATPAAPPAIPEDAVNVRSMRGEVPPELVRYIAKYAEGRKLTKEAYPEAPTESAESLAKRFCGRVTEAYRGAFLTLNGRAPGTFSFDAKLGEADAYSLEWPACLVISAEGGVHKVLQGDNAADIYTEFTGSAGGPDTRFLYFGKKANLAKLKIGDELAYPWTSVTTQFRPRKDIADLDRQAFVDGLREVVEARALADGDVPLAYVRIDEELLRDKGDAIPRIVAAADVGPNGVLAPPAECVGKSPGVLPGAVRKAFAEANKEGAQTVRVLVVDNGFFPAVYDLEGDKLTVGPNYLGHVVRVPGPGRIGPNIKVGDDVTYTPILDPAAIAPDEISGHGTHVAGLILGGAAFAKDRAFLANGPNSSWLKVSIANVGNGEQYLPSNAAEVLDTALGKPDEAPEIINLSVVYTRRHAPRFNLISTTFSKTLFVVAAGNDKGASVLDRQLYPAALGGRRMPNIITVASSRGDRTLATFSNVGETAVDIAADGCMLSSWIDFEGEPRALSGTSQSTPLVAFTAAMIRALVGPTATPSAIKSRILISGDLLKPGKDGKVPPVYSRSTLNIAKALYVRSDYIRFKDVKAGRTVTALGKLTQLSGAGCEEFPLKQFSAFKQEDKLLVGFRRDDLGVDIPCPAVIRDQDRVWFQIESEIGPDGTLTPAPEAAKRIDLVNVHEFVRRMPGFE